MDAKALLGVNLTLKRLRHVHRTGCSTPAVITFDCLNLQSIHYHAVIPAGEESNEADERGVMVMVEGTDVCDQVMSVVNDNSRNNIVYVAINTADGVWHGKSNIIFCENTIHPKMQDDIGICTTFYAPITIELFQHNDPDDKFECEFDIEIIDLMQYSNEMHQEDAVDDEFKLEEIQSKYSYTSNTDYDTIGYKKQNEHLNDVTSSVNNSSVMLNDTDMSELKAIFNKDRYTQFYNETAINEYPNDLEIENILMKAESARRDKIDQVLFPPRAASQAVSAQRYKNNKKKVTTDGKNKGEGGYFFSRVGPSDPKATLNLLKSKVANRAHSVVTSADRAEDVRNTHRNNPVPNNDITQRTKVTSLAEVGVPLPLPTPMFFQKE